MSTRLAKPILCVRVSTAQTSGQEFHVRKEVVRVGNSPGLEVSIEGIAAHALTLQRHSDHLTVIVRAVRSLFIAGKVVPSGSSLSWMPGEELQIDGQATLLFDFVEESKAAEPSRYVSPTRKNGDLSVNDGGIESGKDKKTESAQNKIKVMFEVGVLGVVGLGFYMLMSGDMDRWNEQLLGKVTNTWTHADLVTAIEGEIRTLEATPAGNDEQLVFWRETRQQLQIAFRHEEKAQIIYRTIFAKVYERAQRNAPDLVKDRPLSSTERITDLFANDSSEHKLVEFLIRNL